MKSAFQAAKSKVSSAVETTKARSKARQTSAGGSMDVDASLRGVGDYGDAREALREAREHANSLERAQAALNGEMRRMANEYERVRG